MEGSNDPKQQPPPGGFGAGGSASEGGAPHDERIARNAPLVREQPAPSSYQPPGEPGMLGFAYDHDNKKRGGCLTAFLALMLIANPLTAIFYIVGADFVKKGLPSAPDWALPVLAFCAAVNAVCALGIWMWKKWGVIGVLGMAVIAMFINLSIGIPPINAIMGLMGPGILVFLVRPLWRGFK